MKESGVNDLPTRQKMFFAMAIKCERQGEAVQADEYLDKALKC